MELFPDNALENHLLRVAGLPRRSIVAVDFESAADGAKRHAQHERC
jgi:hypothetical protein